MKAIRKSLAVLLCLAILIGFVSIQSSAAQSVWDGTFPAVNGSAKYSGGKGTKTDPYKIATAKDLAQLSVNTQEIKNYSEGKYFEQTADIVLNTQDMFTFDSDGRVTGIAAGKSPKQWKPIGKAIYNPGGSIADRTFTFYGHYRGDHHKISGIYIDTDESYQGFFGMIVEGSVSEVEIEMSYIKGYISVGGIVGYNDEGTLFECGFAGCVSGYNEVGGLVGHSTGSIQNCFNAAAVSATGIHCGGIVGYNSFGDVSDCFNIGNIEGTNYMGGIAGYSSGTLVRCYNAGTISGNYYVGGVAGFNHQGNVNKTCNTGTVSGRFYVSGIAGYLHEGELKNSYNTGTISGNNYVGGVVAYLYNGSVINTYNCGSVKAENENYGGVCGKNDSGTVTNSYYYKFTMFEVPGAVGTGLTETQMKQQNWFVGFDFIDVWQIDPNAAYKYPTLRDMFSPLFAPSGIQLNKTKLNLKVGETGTLTASVLPAETQNKGVIWSSSKTDVATVQNGVVTAKKAGTATITARTEVGGYIATCNVTVTAEPVYKITLKSGSSYKLNSSGTIAYNIKPGTKVSDLLKNFEGGTLEVRDKNGTLLSGDKTFGSGAKLNLIAGGKVVDTLTLAVLGDIDGDGKVLASDARQVLRHAAKLTTLGELEQLSANTDGEAGVKASDARIILRVAAKLQTL